MCRKNMAERAPWGFTSFYDCTDYHSPNVYSQGYCNATWDNFLCWPMTPVNTTALLPCPRNIKGILDSESASRRCSEDGYWIDYEGNESTDVGWTNFTTCFSPDFYQRLREEANKTEAELEYQRNILESARILEMVGYSVSFASILASIVIISAFRSLKSAEKRIHRQLYVAMLIQIVIRLILYTDQYILRQGSVVEGSAPSSSSNATDTDDATGRNASVIEDDNRRGGEHRIVRGIDNTPYLCESFYVLLEYARTVMFHWFFIEGLHLHNVLTINVFPSTGGRKLYYVIGWCVPALMTIAWASVTGNFVESECWTGYNFTPYYWILEGPRMAIIATNTLFLLNILRVLLTKLRNSNSSETVQVRKALKAAIVLQPLLGTTNILMVATPQNTTGSYFAIWTFLTVFLVSFQGFFAALFYCFLNGEVRQVLGKYFENRQNIRSIQRAAEASSYSHDYTGNPTRRFSRQGSLPAIFHNSARRMSSTFSTHPWNNGNGPNSIGRKTRFRSDAQSSLSGVAELLSNNRKGHLNQLSPIVSMETVTAVGVGGTTATELVRNDKTVDFDDVDDNATILPAITKKIIVFDEEDELRALDSELNSRDDIDKISPNPSPNVPRTSKPPNLAIPRTSIDKSYLVTPKEDTVYDKTISSPLIEDKDDDGEHFEKINVNNVRTLEITKQCQDFGENSMYINNTSPQNQRHSSLRKGIKLQQSRSDNGISQTLIERRSLLPLPENATNGDHPQLGNSIQSHSATAIMSNKKHEINGKDNSNGTAISTDDNSDAPGR